VLISSYFLSQSGTTGKQQHASTQIVEEIRKAMLESKCDFITANASDVSAKIHDKANLTLKSIKARIVPH
jgi:hypothetical protein